MCYWELVKGEQKPVTACRETFKDCRKLHLKVKRGSSTLIKGSTFKTCRTILGEYPWSRMGGVQNWIPSKKEGSYWSPKGCMLNKKDLFQRRYQEKGKEFDIKLKFELVSSELTEVNYDKADYIIEDEQRVFLEVGRHMTSSHQEYTFEHSIKKSRSVSLGVLQRKGESSTIAFSRSREYKSASTVTDSQQNQQSRSSGETRSSLFSLGLEASVSSDLFFVEASATANISKSWGQEHQTERTYSSTRERGKAQEESKSNRQEKTKSNSSTHEIESNRNITFSEEEEKKKSSKIIIKGDRPGKYLGVSVVKLLKGIEKKFKIKVNIKGFKILKGTKRNIEMRRSELWRYLKKEIDLNSQRLYVEDGLIYAILDYVEYHDVHVLDSKAIPISIEGHSPKSFKSSKPTLKDRSKKQKAKFILLEKDGEEVSAFNLYIKGDNVQAYLNGHSIGGENITVGVIPNKDYVLKCVWPQGEDIRFKKQVFTAPRKGSKKKIYCP